VVVWCFCCCVVLFDLEERPKLLLMIVFMRIILYIMIYIYVSIYMYRYASKYYYRGYYIYVCIEADKFFFLLVYRVYSHSFGSYKQKIFSMFCCACHPEEEEIEKEGIELGTFSIGDDSKKKKEEEEERIQGDGRRKRWYLDVRKIEFRDEDEEKQIKKVVPDLDDVRYLKWCNRSKPTLELLERQLSVEQADIARQKETNFEKKKINKLPSDEKDQFLDKLLQLAEKVDNGSEHIISRNDNAEAERKRRMEILKADREKKERNTTMKKLTAEIEKKREEEKEKTNMTREVEEEKVEEEDISIKKRDVDELVEVKPVWVSGGPGSAFKEKKKRQEIGGLLSDLRSLHIDDSLNDNKKKEEVENQDTFHK